MPYSLTEKLFLKAPQKDGLDNNLYDFAQSKGLARIAEEISGILDSALHRRMDIAKTIMETLQLERKESIESFLASQSQSGIKAVEAFYQSERNVPWHEIKCPRTMKIVQKMFESYPEEAIEINLPPEIITGSFDDWFLKNVVIAPGSPNPYYGKLSKKLSGDPVFKEYLDHHGYLEALKRKYQDEFSPIKLKNAAAGKPADDIPEDIRLAEKFLTKYLSSGDIWMAELELPFLQTGLEKLRKMPEYGNNKKDIIKLLEEVENATKRHKQNSMNELHKQRNKSK